MTIRLATGFEWFVSNVNGSPDGSSTSATLSTTTKRSGNSSLSLGASQTSYIAFVSTPSASTTAWLSFFIYIPTAWTPPGTSTPIASFGVGSSEAVRLQARSDGQFELRANTGVSTWTVVGSPFSIARDSWEMVTLGAKYNGASSMCEAYIDDVLVVSQDPITMNGTSTSWGVTLTNPGTASAIFIDDLIIVDSDSTFGSNNTRPNWWQRVYGLLPSSDVQRGSWTGGAGGTTNLWDAINNTPPKGTATETNLTQIESADGSGDNSIDEYRPGFETLTSKGVATNGSTIVAKGASGYICHGEDVSTGTKTGAINFSTPSSTDILLFTFGDDVGALGTYPATWKWTRPIIMDFWSIADGTTPQMQLRKTDTGTRVASVCFLGMYVVVTDPAPVTATIEGSWGMDALIA